MRRIHDMTAHNKYVGTLAACALEGTWGAYWLGSAGTSVMQSARWVRPVIIG